jgi:thiamine kinase-like enzyme
VTENETLTLLQTAPEERLVAWLAEFYGKPVEIQRRELLRHRDLSFVERLWIADALPSTLIYKLVLPPWDIEQDLHERILIPSIAQSAQLFMSAHFGQMTAMFLEDLGNQSLLTIEADAEFAAEIGKELAKLHRSYSYRIEELLPLNILRNLLPADYAAFTQNIIEQLQSWGLLAGTADGAVASLKQLADLLADKLSGEPVSLVHGDLYAENILVRGNHVYFIDWSWFTMIGVPTMDLASLTSDHFKNGAFRKWRDTVLDAYCFESGRKTEEVIAILPHAETLSRLLFLNWLVVRRERGIMGTTVGPVDELIPKVVDELVARYESLK